MNTQTFKRQAEDVNLSDEVDGTWGNKRCRYLYNYTLQSDLFSNNSDQTDSVYSGQTKSTILLADELDLSSSSCGSNCDCGSSTHTEFEVVSSCSSSSFNKIHPNCSDSSSIIEEFEITTNAIDVNKNLNSSESGYLPDTDAEVILPKTNLPPPACFQNCLQCRSENPNPYFQYCYKCFRGRLEFFENKPGPKHKNFKRLISCVNITDCKKEDNPIMDSQESSGSFGISSLYLSQKENENNVENDRVIEINRSAQNLCNVCFMRPKNGVFNHGKTSHAYSCYPCSKKIWNRTGRCPVCNVKVKHIVRIIVV